MVETFLEPYEDRLNYAKQWKKENPDGKILGYFRTYVSKLTESPKRISEKIDHRLE